MCISDLERSVSSTPWQGGAQPKTVLGSISKIVSYLMKGTWPTHSTQENVAFQIQHQEQYKFLLI